MRPWNSKLVGGIRTWSSRSFTRREFSAPYGRQARLCHSRTLRPAKPRLCRLGYAAQGTNYQFSREVSASLERAAKEQGIELIALDNRYSAKTAQRNADLLVREKVDLAIEFQTDEPIAPIVANKYREA